MKIQVVVTNKNTGADASANKLRMMFANIAIHFYKLQLKNLEPFKLTLKYEFK